MDGADHAVHRGRPAPCVDRHGDGAPAGAVLKLDGKDLEQTRFSTCTAQGSLLPVSFPTAVTDTISKAKMLTVAAQSISNGQAVVFNVSLNGFAAALERTIQLGS
ncbi:MULTISPECIES: invasion associated locus B family protein [Bradyrhizobium]|uniref:invasion associated locus B family protein n=1 Tax=Bradyrhizobium brasilense TaxID=1419277 RepID=UPI001FCD0B28|nr:invasion associated locus B family protein [Bradyrhizobium brasilense]MCP1914333.1 invasion protein IalB [Bradyrhizobium elkanii]